MFKRIFLFLSQTSPTKLALGRIELRPWEEHTPRSQANTTRPTQMGYV